MTELAEVRAKNAELESRIAALEASQTGPKYKPEKPNGALSARLDASYLKNKPRLQAQLTRSLADRYASLAHGDNYARSQSAANGYRLDIETLPRPIAAQPTREADSKDELESVKRASAIWGTDEHHDNQPKIDRLEVELAARVAHTQDLLTSTTLPPIPGDLRTIIERPAKLRTNHSGIIGVGWSAPQ